MFVERKGQFQVCRRGDNREGQGQRSARCCTHDGVKPQAKRSDTKSAAVVSMYDRALFLADSVVQLVLSENKAGRADAKIELSTIVSKVSSCPCLPQLRACFAVNMHQRRMHVAVKCQLICSIFDG